MNRIDKVGPMAALICFHSCAVALAIKEWITFMSARDLVICFSSIATTHNQVDECGLGAPFG
jgi:hypothetical protein